MAKHEKEVAEKCALILYALGNEDVFHWLKTSPTEQVPTELRGLNVSPRSFYDVAVLLRHKVEWLLALLLLRTFLRSFCSPPPCRLSPDSFSDVVEALIGAVGKQKEDQAREEKGKKD